MKGVNLYVRVATDLERKISGGDFEATGQIPPENELAREYGVARMTIRHAIDQLISQGLLVRRHGLGTYLTGETSPSRSLNQLLGYKDEMAAERMAVETRVLRLAAEEPPADVAVRLGLLVHNKAVRVKRLRLANGRPMAVQDSWLPYTLCPALPGEQLVAGSLYATLSERYGVNVSWADQSIAAVAADEELAELLDVRVGSPLLHTERLTYDNQNCIVEFARSWMRPGHRATVRLQRT